MHQKILFACLSVALCGCGTNPEETSAGYEITQANSQRSLVAARDTFFKISTADSTDLSWGAGKCRLQQGGHYQLARAASQYGAHYIVELTRPVPGCEFRKGYVYGGHLRSIWASGDTRRVVSRSHHRRHVNTRGDATSRCVLNYVNAGYSTSSARFACREGSGETARDNLLRSTCVRNYVDAGYSESARFSCRRGSSSEALSTSECVQNYIDAGVSPESARFSCR